MFAELKNTKQHPERAPQGWCVKEDTIKKNTFKNKKQ
jgi:hypothetical protein